MSGADSKIKKEIDEIFDGLMRNLNQLSNVHFTPKRKTKETTIRTQNVPALQLEEALPIAVSSAQAKTAREVFTIEASAMRDKSELSKEEKHKERRRRKQHISTHMKAKSIKQKEQNRVMGIAQGGDRFEAKRLAERSAMKKKKEKKDKDTGESLATKQTSANVFKNLNLIAKQDEQKRDNKRKFRETGKAQGGTLHNNGSAKRFKM